MFRLVYGSLIRLHIYVFSQQIDNCLQSQLTVLCAPRNFICITLLLAMDSDSFYHRLFAHPQMVEALVQEFVPSNLQDGLDFSKLQRVNPKFHSRWRSTRRDGDVIWRLPTCAGSDIYLYLLIEFQSTTDPWMAVRTQVYQGLLWQQVIDEQNFRVSAQLPPLLLLVIYNGQHRWRMAKTSQALIALPSGSALWRWQPNARYHVLDIGAFSQNELARRSSLIALLFRLEQWHSPGALEELLDDVVGWFRQHAGFERLQGLFAELIREVSVRSGVTLPGSSNLLEVKNMLTINFEEWRKQGRAEGTALGRAEGRTLGRAEGRAEGKVEGKTEGKIEGKTEAMAEALLSLLRQRFGAVAPSRRKRIHKARLATLERWFERALVASNLRSVFNPPVK